MKNIQIGILVIFLALAPKSWSQIKSIEKVPPKEKIISTNSFSDSKLKESVTVLVHLPKSLFSQSQIISLLNANNHLFEISAQSIIQKKECNESVLKNKSLSDCWIRSTSTNPISVLAQNYILLTDNNPEYYLLQATVSYPNLAPKTALISVFVESKFLQSVKSGTWNISTQTLCDFQIPMNRWSEFVFQPNAGTRGFAIRGFSGSNSICSLPKKTDTVAFWITNN